MGRRIRLAQEDRSGIAIVAGFRGTRVGVKMKQFDLFFDSRETRARNALHDALAQADANEARRAHDELSDLEPSHRWLPHASTLIAALETPLPTDADGGLAILARLDGDWTVAADEIFGEGEHDLLVPFWRAVGHVLKGVEFDPERPDLHASHAWMKIGEWASVERCIRDVPDYRAHPALLSRMAEAIWRQQRWAEAADHWFALCWLAPEEFQRLMERGDIRDRTLRDGWHTGLDQDLDPAMTAAWFPRMDAAAQTGVGAIGRGPGRNQRPRSRVRYAVDVDGGRRREHRCAQASAATSSGAAGVLSFQYFCSVKTAD